MTIRARPGTGKWFFFDGGVMFSVAHLRFFGVFCMACNGWCTAHCSASLLPSCFASARHRPHMALPSRIPSHYWHTRFFRHRSAIPKIWQLSAIYVSADLHRVEFRIWNASGTHLERIWLYWRASGTHAPRKRMVSRGRPSLPAQMERHLVTPAEASGHL